MNRTGNVTELEKETLPWADYLSIRKKKRRWETVRLGANIIHGADVLCALLLFAGYWWFRLGVFA